jgi:membrane protein required for colicin V production
MNVLDVIIIATILFFVIRGIFRGFIRELASLVGIVLGIVLGIRLLPQVADFLGFYLPKAFPLSEIGFAVIFFAILIFCNILGIIVRFLFVRFFLGWFDKGLGAVLAVFKGVIIIYLAMVFITFRVPSKAPLIAQSQLAPQIIASYQLFTRLVSPKQYKKWQDWMTRKGEEIGDSLSEKTKDAVE